jgi:hypothetical protein
VPGGVEAVDRERREVEEVHQALDRAGAVEARGEIVEVGRDRPSVAGEVGEVADQRPGADQRRPAGHRRAAEALERRARALCERAELGEQAAHVLAGGVEVARHRGRLVGEAAEVGHQRAQLAEEARQALDAALDVVAAGGGRLAGRVGLGDEAADALLLTGERRQRLIGAAREVGEPSSRSNITRATSTAAPMRPARAAKRATDAPGGRA